MQILGYDWSKPGANVLLSELLSERLTLEIESESAAITADKLEAVASAIAAGLEVDPIVLDEPQIADGPTLRNVPCSAIRCGDPRGHSHDVKTVDVFLPVLGGDPTLLVARPGRGGGPDVSGASYDAQENAVKFRVSITPGTRSEIDRQVGNIKELVDRSNAELGEWNATVKPEVASSFEDILSQRAKEEASKDALGLPRYGRTHSPSQPSKPASPELSTKEDPMSPTQPPTFISYVHENSTEVHQLKADLQRLGLETWIDREQLKAGDRWKQEIKKAISSGGGFIACFSRELEERDKSYVYEELTVAIDEIRQRPKNRAWMIPVRLNECAIPDLEIGGGESLADINYVDWFADPASAAQEIAEVLTRTRPDSGV